MNHERRKMMWDKLRPKNKHSREPEKEVSVKVNFRQKFILDNLKICKNKFDKLNDWEQRFVLDIENKVNIHIITQLQYNKLSEISTKVSQL